MDFKCTDCGEPCEVVQSMDDDKLIMGYYESKCCGADYKDNNYTCPECGRDEVFERAGTLAGAEGSWEECGHCGYESEVV